MPLELKRELVITPNGPAERYVKAEWYMYRSQITALAPAGQATDSVLVDSDSEFVIQRISYACDIAGAAQTVTTVPVPHVLVQINDSGSGENLFQSPVSIGAFAGTGQLPHILPVSRRLRPNSNIIISYTSFEAAVTYANLRLYLEGYKAYPYAG